MKEVASACWLFVAPASCRQSRGRLALAGEKCPRQIQRAASRPPLDSVFDLESGLDRLDVLGLPALRAFDHVELHLLTFLEAAESTGLNRGEVHEYILPVLAADETITLSVVKPLYCSCFHGVALFLLLRCCAEIFRRTGAGRSRR